MLTVTFRSIAVIRVSVLLLKNCGSSALSIVKSIEAHWYVVPPMVNARSESMYGPLVMSAVIDGNVPVLAMVSSIPTTLTVTVSGPPTAAWNWADAT